MGRGRERGRYGGLGGVTLMRRRWTTLSWPEAAALCKAVLPVSRERSSTAEPFARRNLTATRLPTPAAEGQMEQNTNQNRKGKSCERRRGAALATSNTHTHLA